MASFSRLKSYSLPLVTTKPAYPPQVALCNMVKKRLDYQKLVLNCATSQFGQLGRVKWHMIQRNTIVRSEIVAPTAGSSDDSSNTLAGSFLFKLVSSDTFGGIFFSQFGRFFSLLGVSHASDSHLISRIRGVCFYLATATIVVPLFIAMALLHPFILLFDPYRRRAHHFIAKLWASFTIWPFYKFEIEGLENLPPNTTPSVYVSNHQSFLDIYTLLTLGRCFKFISKTSIFVYPIIGWAMFLMGVVPLRRMDSRSQLDCLKRCVDLVTKGASVFFFPEGTRSKDGKLGVFKKGAFSVAVKTRAPIVPITLLGTGKLMPSGHEGIINSGSVKIIIHKPIEGTDAEALCNETRNVIAKSLLMHGYGVH